MKVKRLQTQDFMGLSGIRDYEFSGQAAALCGGNAQGKTSVLNALRYGLTGAKPDGELVAKGCARSTVQVKFADGSSIARMEYSAPGKSAAYYVDRKRSTLGAVNLKLSAMAGNKGGVPKIIAASDLLRRLSPQEFGELLLGYLPETMTKEDVISRVPGLTEPMADTIRENMPDGDFGAAELDRFHAGCVEKRRELKNRIKELKAVIGSYSGFPAPQETAEKLQKQLEQTQKERDRAVAYVSARSEYEKLRRQADSHMKLIRDAEAGIGDSEPAAHSKEERDAASAALGAHRKAAMALYSSLERLKASAEALKKAITGIGQPVCPLSEKLVCTTDKTSVLDDLKSEYSKTVKEYNKQLEQYREEKKEEEKAGQALQKIDADNAEAKRISGLKENLKRLRDTMPKVPEEPKPAGDAAQLAAQLEAIRKKLKCIQDAGKVKEYQEKLSKYEEMLSRYDYLADAFSPKGEAKKAVIRYYLDGFSASCNEKAGRLFPGMKLRFVPENGVTVLVDPKGTGEYISISSLSEGEKAGVTFLLMSLLSDISGFRILILDELSVLDAGTLSTLLDLLDEHKDEYDLALLACVDHEDSVRILKEHGVQMLEA